MTYKPRAIPVHGKTLSDCSHAANSYPCSQAKHPGWHCALHLFLTKKGEERPANEEIQEHRLCQKTRLIKALRVGPSIRTAKYQRQLRLQPLKLLIASRWQGYQGLPRIPKTIWQIHRKAYWKLLSTGHTSTAEHIPEGSITKTLGLSSVATVKRQCTVPG